LPGSLEVCPARGWCRDEGRIDDTVLRQLQARLDREEVRLSRRELTE